MTNLMTGPCVVCGGTNYGLSMGGPTICPSCDCGNFTEATVMRQTKHIANLTAELEAARAAVLAYNSALRSAHAIAEREGRETNWPPYLKSVKAVIDAHHETFVRALKAQPMPEAGPGEIGGAVAP